MKSMRLFGFWLVLLIAFASMPAQAADYVIDTEKGHAAINFRIKHLGYSWVYGRFNEFSGRFSYDKTNPEGFSVQVDIDPASIDTNHAERDKHLRGDEYFHVKRYPEARFVSTRYEPGKQAGEGQLHGKLTLHGQTNPVTIDVTHTAAGPDPWGGYRRGFSGTTTIEPANFGMDYDLGPGAERVELMLSIEGIRQ